MHLPALTSLRFVAALMVVLSHLPFLEKSEFTALAWLQSKVFREGYIGVTFFFILSGFILAHSYDNRFHSKTIRAGQFLQARVARIVPLHVLTFLIGALLVLQTRDSIWMSHFVQVAAANLSLTHAFVPELNWYFSVNSPSWSISVEMFFYALFPLLIMLRTRHLLVFGFAIGLIKLALLGSPATSTHYFQYICPPLRLADFILGIAAYRMSKEFRASLEPRASQLQLLSLGVLALALVCGEWVSQAARYDLYYLLPMCFVVTAFSLEPGRLWKWLEHKHVLLLGEASFALYMIHYLVIMSGEHLRNSAFSAGTMAYAEACAIGYVFASIALSIVLHLYFELPAKKLVLRQFAALSTRSATV